MNDDVVDADVRNAASLDQELHTSDAGRSIPASVTPSMNPRAWYVIFMLVMISIFSVADRMALAMLAPSIKADLSLSDAQIGLLTGLAFSVFYATCGIPVARWADRGVRRNIIAFSLAIWSAMTAISGAAQGFWSMFIARLGIGAGQAGYLPAAQSVICDYVPITRRSAVFAIHSLGACVGTLIGLMLVGWLDEKIGWRMAFVALGLPGLALALLVRLTLHEPRREAFDGRTPDSIPTFGATIAVLLRCRTYKLLTLFYVLNGFVQYGLTQWWPSFYARQYGLSLSSIGLTLGLALGGGTAIGVIVGGILANRAAKRDIRIILHVGGAAAILSFPLALCSLFLSSATLSILLVSLTGFFWSVPYGPVLATITGIVGSPMRATAGAITMSFSTILGFGLGPLCVGILSDLLTPTYGIMALRGALLLPVSLIPFIAGVLYLAAKALPGDLRSKASVNYVGEKSSDPI